MKNKKTTIAGILLIVGAVATGASQILSGDADFMTVFASIGAAVTGAGFLNSGDGGL
jgi:hypothetical protein